jgi:hypothetical protein
MIIRDIVNRENIEPFDWFNDYEDTLHWLEWQSQHLNRKEVKKKLKAAYAAWVDRNRTKSPSTEEIQDTYARFMATMSKTVGGMDASACAEYSEVLILVMCKCTAMTWMKVRHKGFDVAEIDRLADRIYKELEK